MNDDTEVLLEISPSPMRRWMALFCLIGLAVLLVTLAIGDVPDLWRLFFVLLGAGVLWAGNRLRISTTDGLVLTRDKLSTKSGRLLAQIDNVETVERGVFAFKPSNGFLIRLKTSDGNGWSPGLWWKTGRKIGVGGTLSGGQSRSLADMMSMLLVERDSDA